MKTKELKWTAVLFQAAIFMCAVILLGFWQEYTLYFSEIHLYFDYTEAVFLGIFIGLEVLVFVNMNRFMKNTKAGIVTGICLSVEMLMMLLFAQYYPVVFVVIFAAAIIFSAVFYRIVLKINLKKRENSAKLRHWCHARTNSLVAYLLCIVLLIPSCVGCYYEYCRESLSRESWSDFSEWFVVSPGSEKEKDFPYSDKLAGLLEWDTLSPKEKERMVRAVAMVEKDNLGIADDVEITVYTEKMSEYTCGYYSDTDKEIFINYKYLNESSVYDVLKTVLHEMHHAFVFYTIETTDFDSTLVKESYYFKQAREWKENSENYISAAISFEEYRNQPIESDARNYASLRINFYHNFIGDKD